MAELIVAVFLVAHALIHLGFVSPAPPAKEGAPAWPFDLGRSALLRRAGLSPAAARTIALALLVAVLAGFIVAALAALSIAPEGLFAPGVVVGSLASLAMLILFFHAWLTLGIAIDVVLLWLVAVAGWTP